MASIPVPRQGIVPRDLGWQAIGVCERIASAGLLAVFSPVLAGSAAVLWVLSGRTPFIAHRRVGWRGETLWMLKLRTMWNGKAPNGERRSPWVEYIDDDCGPQQKESGDPRVTHAFARFCRRHSIDEVPQLWHVIRGEMALIGPRPETASEIRRYYGADADEVLQVKPGIAGLWQTSGRNRLTYAERRRLDLDFVRNRSLGMYARILLRTVGEVWNGENAW